MEPNTPLYYQIRVGGRLDEGWAAWFEGMDVSAGAPADGRPTTILTGLVADQAALHGLLTKIRDLALPLLSLNPVETDGERGTGRQNY